MPDLSTHAVTAWLREHEPAIADDYPIAPIEEATSVQPLLPQLGEALDHALKRDPVALSGNLSQDPMRDSMRAVLAQMGSARRLRVLAWLAEAGLPDTHAVLGTLLEMDASGSGRALRDSLRSHYRRALLARMFVPERIEQVMAACREKTP